MSPAKNGQIVKPHQEPTSLRAPSLSAPPEAPGGQISYSKLKHNSEAHWAANDHIKLDQNQMKTVQAKGDQRRRRTNADKQTNERRRTKWDLKRYAHMRRTSENDSRQNSHHAISGTQSYPLFFSSAPLCTTDVVVFRNCKYDCVDQTVAPMNQIDEPSDF